MDIYTDGSSLDQTKTYGKCRGGYAAVMTRDNHLLFSINIPEYSEEVTNNTMEMKALRAALRIAATTTDEIVTIYSDSNYCVECINEWIPGWVANGWKKKKGAIANLELWKEIWEMYKEAEQYVSVIWIKAHVTPEFIEAHPGQGYEWNALADELAGNAAAGSDKKNCGVVESYEE